MHGANWMMSYKRIVQRKMELVGHVSQGFSPKIYNEIVRDTFLERETTEGSIELRLTI